MAPDTLSQNRKPHEQINKLIHEPARLIILTNLYIVEKADYIYLMRQTGMSMANLSAHLGKLEAAGIVSIQKSFKGKKPYTTISLNEDGRAIFREYRSMIEKVFDDLPD
jgi:DNA-binding transcriptional ArsR family regulator